MPDLTPDAIGELWLSLEDDGKLPSSGALLDHLHQQGHDISKAQVIHRLREFCGGNISDYRRDYEDGAPVVPADATEETLRRVLREHGIDGAAAISGAWVKDGEYSIYVKLPQDETSIIEAGEKALARIRERTPQPVKLGTVRPASDHLFLPSMYDAHFGKRSVDGSYTLDRAYRDYCATTDAMIARLDALRVPVGRVLFVVDNDGLHVDNLEGTTTSGTPVQPIADARDAASAYIEAVYYAVERFNSLAEVDVIVVDGNHSRYSGWWLGRVIDAFYHRNSTVRVDYSRAPRKYFLWGRNLLGFTHGDGVKLQSLAALMALEAAELWAKASWREFHLGHWHRNLTMLMAVAEELGVKGRVHPALCKTDDWHLFRGLVGPHRAADGILYHAEYGPAMEFSVFVDELADIKPPRRCRWRLERGA